MDILRRRREILRFFIKISKLITFSRGRSSVYSVKFQLNDRLISYEEDKTFQRCRESLCIQISKLGMKNAQISLLVSLYSLYQVTFLERTSVRLTASRLSRGLLCRRRIFK